MPLYEYHCTACDSAFELLVRSDTVPTCPHCGSSSALQRLVSRLAPAGKIAGWRRAMRQAAHKEGHFSNYSQAEQAKLLK